MNEWQLQSVVNEYATKAVDPIIGWYEHEVNFPDLVRLIPKNTKSLLDFGCGPGEFMKKFPKEISKVVGADMAPMLVFARKRNPSMEFIEWNGLDPIPTNMGMFDVIFSKMTLQFIEDLSLLASHFSKIMNVHGTLIISIHNPEKIVSEFKLDPDSVVSYDDEIGTTGIKIHPIYRPKHVYIEIFKRNGFDLIETSEPKVSEFLFKKYNAPEHYKIISNRLNFKFTKSN